MLAWPLVLAGCNSGTTLPLQPPPVPIEGLRTEGDRSLVLAFLGRSPRLDPSHPCWESYRPEVAESDILLVVTIRTITSQAPGPESFDCTLEGHPTVLVVELPRPLAGRRVVDGATGRERQPFDGSTLLHLRALPPGWALLQEGPGFDDGERSRSWVRTWGPPLEPGPADECANAVRVDLVQGPHDMAPEPLAPGAATAEPVDVRGTRGLVVRPPGRQVRLAWAEPVGRLELIGYRACDGGPPVEPEVLLRIAEALE